MQRAKEKAHFNQDSTATKTAPKPKPSTADRPEPAIFAKNRALIQVPGVRKREVAPKAPFDGLGRWSFGGENPEVEAAHAALKEKKRKLKALARAKASNDVDVDDDQMAAAAFAKAGRSGKKKGVKRDFVKPPALDSVKRAKV
jgi:M-phase phosphoprotein 6, animal type